jgi:hypothetical protein
MTSTEKNMGNIGIWIVELIVIFLDVYLAFMLKSHRIHKVSFLLIHLRK